MVQADSVVCEGVLCVTTLGEGELIIFSPFGGSGVYTLCFDGSLYVYSTLRGAPDFSGELETGLPFVLGVPTVFPKNFKWCLMIWI